MVSGPFPVLAQIHRPPRIGYVVSGELTMNRILASHVLPVLLGVGSLSAGSGLSNMSVSDLQRRQTEIDKELSRLAHFSLNSGVGPIGYRSSDHDSPDRAEWLEIDLGRESNVDEIVLVPTLWRDMHRGFVADGFPAALRIVARAADGNEMVVAGFPDTSGMLPRVAPLVIPTGGIRAQAIRVEADRLSRRSFDGHFIFQLAEVFVFSGQENLALRRPVRVPDAGEELGAWNRSCVVDGILPYLMNSGRGKPSLAYLSAIGIGEKPVFDIDLGVPEPLSGIRLHAVDQTDTMPQAFAGDYALPRRYRLEGANREDFSDSVHLAEEATGSIHKVGPIMDWRFDEMTCRYLRLTALEPYVSSESPRQGTRIGFAEIELFAAGRNVAEGCPVTAGFQTGGPERRLEALTDAHNLYGRILPLRDWLGELALRHTLEEERPQVVAELAERFGRQRSLLRWMSWIAALLVGGIGALTMYYRVRAMRQEARIRERIAANLHDELGANLHAIGLLGDLAKDSVDSREELLDTLDRIRGLTERTGSAARNCAHMVAAKGVCEDLVEEMRRDTRRLLADLEHSITFEGEGILARLPPRRRIDLYLFHKEALVNVIRHSGATKVASTVAADEKRIRLTITDNGRGISGAAPASLRRRARLLGGDLEVTRPDGGGTRIELDLKTRTLRILR